MVRGRESLFLTRLEKQVQVLDPAETVLTDDLTSNYRASLLYLDTLLRKSPGMGDLMSTGEPGPNPALCASDSPRPRRRHPVSGRGLSYSLLLALVATPSL